MKKVLMGALAIFASLALFSCGGNDDDDDDEIVVTPTQKIINIDIKDATENVTIAKETLADGYKVTFSYDSSTFTETTEGFKAKVVFADGAEGVNYVEGEDVAPVVGNEDFVAVEGEANTYWAAFDFAPNGAEMAFKFRKEGALDTVVTIKFVDTNPAVPTVADPVVASPAAGEAAAGTPVVITCATENAVIAYWFGDGSIEEPELYDPENPFVLTESCVLHVQAAVLNTEGDPVSLSQVVTVEYTVAAAAVKPGNPYSDIADGSACSLTTKIHFYSDVESENDHKGTVYYQFVAEGGQSTLTSSNYAEDGVATKYESSFYFTAPGTYYCIAVYKGAVSDIVTFTYTMIPGRSAGIAAAAKKIGEMTHVTDGLPTADIKDGLIDAKDAEYDNTDPENPVLVSEAVEAVKSYIVSDVAGLNKLAEIVTSGNSLEGYTFTQVADIAFNDAAILNSEFVAESVEGLTVFAGIGAKGKAFAGTYDGNGYKISHMYIYAAHSELGFVCCSAATTVLKNIILDDVYVTPSCENDSSDDRAGGLLGRANGAGTVIDNCVVIGAVGNQANVDAYNAASAAGTFDSTKDGKPEHFGGLIGAADKAVTASNCLVVAKVIAYQGTGVIVASTKSSGLTADATVVGYDASLE